MLFPAESLSMKKNYRKITVKIGSNVITRKDGKLDITRISALVDQVAALHQQGIEVILISSGAVAAGKSTITAHKTKDTVDERQLYAAVGQAKLMNYYWDLFREHGITVGQVLTTKDNFSNRRGYLNQRNCIRVMLDNGIVPVVNENDAVSVTELMFTDNDELSGMIASMMGSEALFILSNVDGIFTGLPSDPEADIIPVIKKGQNISDYILHTKSVFGRGGMTTKAKIASKIAEEGIDVFITNGKRENIILKLAHSEAVPCTHFEAEKNAVSSIKKWIAHSDGFAKGKVFINENAVKALTATQATSLLPVGILNMEGTFEKDDIIRIMDQKGKYLGVGKAAYSSEELVGMIGLKNQKAFVHYDYMFLE